MNGWRETWRHQERPWEFAWLDKDTEPMKRGDKVRIIRPRGDGMTLLVEHEQHGQHLVGAGVLDPPREFKTARGRWIPENDPRVRTFLLKALADLRSGGKKVEASGDPLLRQRTEAEILRLLVRNGWQENPTV